MKPHLHVLYLALLTALTALAEAPLRTFTNNQGKQIMAALVSFDGRLVVLRTPDGRQYTMPAASLSPQDKDYLRSQERARPAQAGVGLPPMPAAGMPAPAPPSSVGPDTRSNYGGMSLGTGWMPQRNETKRELLEGIVFYSRQVLENTPPGKERTPTMLSPGITWLMPFEQAVARLPARVIKMGERMVNNNCFPAGCLTLASFQFKSFMDKGRPFNLLHLLLDQQRRVVGVQFVQQTPGRTTYDLQGRLEPYYNFLTLTNNASTSKEVVYAILPGEGPGVKVIQTVFRDFANDIPNGLPQMPGSQGIGGRGLPQGLPMVNPTTPGAVPWPVKVHEIVHWYLAEPFARCLLEIAEKNGVRAP